MADSDPVTKKDLIDLEARLEAKLDAKLDAKLEALGDRLTEFTRSVETNLLTSFHGYGKGQALRLHTLEVGDAAVKGRLEALEERVLNLETRRPH
jgi:hypothetical protein